VPQRGHAIVLPCADTRGGLAFGPEIGGAPTAPGAVNPAGGAFGAIGDDIGTGVANGPGGGIAAGGIIGAPTAGASAGDPGVV
jgi:hypothetical protein